MVPWSLVLLMSVFVLSTLPAATHLAAGLQGEVLTNFLPHTDHIVLHRIWKFATLKDGLSDSEYAHVLDCEECRLALCASLEEESFEAVLQRLEWPDHGATSVIFCEGGHRIHLEVRDKTDQRIQTISCLSCGAEVVLVSPYVLNVIPGPDST